MAWGHVCGTAKDLFLVAGTALGTEIHRWNGTASEPLYQDSEAAPGLEVFCGPGEAMALLPGPEISKLVILPAGKP